tara:strand:- start:42387 stop:42812 length:426 start_codon:yes stop_codon:yes gene_type:complete
MRNNILIFTLIAFSLSACNKAKRTEKKMAGEWKIISYTFQNLNGFSYKYPGSGTFTFDSCSDEFCNYNLALTYNIDGVVYQKNNNGLYDLLDDAEHYTLIRNNPSGTVSTFVDNRILLINKDQLKTLFQDEIGIHELVLEK